MILKAILSEQQVALAIKRLAHHIVENNPGLKDTALIGLQPRGIFFSDRIVKEIKDLAKGVKINYGQLDITFYRDDIHKHLHTANKTDIPFSIDEKTVVIIDDVLMTGRTIRAAFDALLDFGRPRKVELCVLIDRRFTREYPIKADYVGRAIDTFPNQKVMVYLNKGTEPDRVELLENVK